MKRSKLVVVMLSVAVLNTMRDGLAAEPVATEPMALEFSSACKSMALEEELSGPGVVKPRLSPKFPPKPPKYPEESSKRGEEGAVQMLLLVNEKGRVVQARVVRSSGFPALDRASLESSEEWRLEPGKVDGKPTCMWFTFTSFWKL